MQPVSFQYGEYLDARLDGLTTIRHLGQWELLTATEGETKLILAVNHEARSVIGRRNITDAEYGRDLALVRAIPEDAGPDGTDPIGAWLNPPPPTRPAADPRRPEEPSS